MCFCLCLSLILVTSEIPFFYLSLNNPYLLLQTEQGDIFKITLETDEDMVTEIKLKYFDTVPVAAGMNVLKTGFLFVASEFGNHYLYQVILLPFFMPKEVPIGIPIAF